MPAELSAITVPLRPSGLLALEIRDERGAAHRVLDLQDRHELPSVLAERVEDLSGVVLQQRRHEVFPRRHQIPPSRSSRSCTFLMQMPMMTSRPAFDAIRRASSFTMPSCNHRTLASIATASRATSGVASARRNTSTMST